MRRPRNPNYVIPGSSPKAPEEVEANYAPREEELDKCLEKTVRITFKNGNLNIGTLKSYNLADGYLMLEHSVGPGITTTETARVDFSTIKNVRLGSW